MIPLDTGLGLVGLVDDVRWSPAKGGSLALATHARVVVLQLRVFFILICSKPPSGARDAAYDYHDYGLRVLGCPTLTL